jgi:hypothetical protein
VFIMNNTNSMKKSGLAIKTTIKAGGLATANHNRAGIKIRAAIKAGGLATANHNRAVSVR